jgi:hypothetical protein
MTRLRLILVAAMALFAFAAVASAASAHNYRVEGVNIVGDHIDIHTVDLTHVQVFHATPFGVATQIECKHTVSLFLLKEGGLSSGSNVYSFCTVVKPAKCTLKETTAKISGELLTAAETKFSATEKSFDTINLEGAECSLHEKPFEVTGTQKCTSPEAESEKAEHTIQCTTAGSELKAGGKVATYEGTISGLEIVNESGTPTGQLYSSV